MKRFSRALIFSLFLVIFASSSAVAKKTYKFVTEPLPPFNYEEFGGVAGPSSDIINEVCRRMKITCVFEITEWREAYLKAKKGRVDGIFSIGKSYEREAWLHYSLPLIKTAYGFFVQKSNVFTYKNAKSLSKMELSVYGPTNASKKLQELLFDAKGSKMIMEEDPKTPFKKLAANRYRENTIIYANRDFGNYLIKVLGIKNLRYVADEQPIRYFVGFPKKRIKASFVKKFNKTIEDLYRDGKIEKILRFYRMYKPKK